MSSNEADEIVERTWENTKLRNLCECEYCKTGKATTHNDPSHDQSMLLKWKFEKVAETALADMRIVGGTTKCARVLTRFLETSEDFGRRFLEQKKIVEVGSGTGLVGIACGMLGAEITLTDQAPVIELLTQNVEANLSKKDLKPSLAGKIKIEELYWGEPVLSKQLEDSLDQGSGVDYVIGADLIFAKENIPLLLTSMKTLGRNPKTQIIYAHIGRFSWEDSFFTGMKDQKFLSQVLYEEDEISVFLFYRDSKPRITPNGAE